MNPRASAKQWGNCWNSLRVWRCQWAPLFTFLLPLESTDENRVQANSINQLHLSHKGTPPRLYLLQIYLSRQGGLWHGAPQDLWPGPNPAPANQPKQPRHPQSTQWMLLHKFTPSRPGEVALPPNSQKQTQVRQNEGEEYVSKKSIRENLRKRTKQNK